MRLRADRKEERRREAKVRNERWSSLTTQQKLDELNTRPGSSLRQRYWLGLQLEEEKTK